MANGQQRAKQNLDAFQVWLATQTHDDFKQIVYRGQLNRGDIAKAIGCGKSALTQNPALKDALKLLEDRLRSEGVLPQLNQIIVSNSCKPKQYDNQIKKQELSNKRVSLLEVENIELKAKVVELEAKLARMGELSETLSEMGFMPR